MTMWTVFNALVFLLGVTIVSWSTFVTRIIWLLTHVQFALGMWTSGYELHNGSGGKVFSCVNKWLPVSAVLRNEE